MFRWKVLLLRVDDAHKRFKTSPLSQVASRLEKEVVVSSIFLEGLLTSINNLHDRVNVLIAVMLFENELKRLHDEKEINARQYAIVSQMLVAGKPVLFSELRKAPWYQGLYIKLTDKTKQRDLKKLRELGLVMLGTENQLRLGYLEPEL